MTALARTLPRLRQARRLLPALALVASLVMDVAAVSVMGLALGNGGVQGLQTSDVETTIGVVLLAVGFPLVGAIILRRDPSSRLGWIYLTIGFWQALNLFSTGYTARAYEVRPAMLPFAAELSWVTIWAWVPSFTLFTTLGILLFPTGRMPSRRWWPVVVLAGVAFVLSLVPTAVAAWPYRGLPLELATARDVPPPPGSALATAFAIQNGGQIVLMAAMLGSIGGLASRFRRSVGIERQQLKWFVFAAVIDLVIIIVWMFNVLPLWAGIATAVVLGLAFPVAIGIAIARYRLFEIDLIIRRTLVYGALSGALVALYVGLVIGLQEALSGIAPGNALAVAGSTLAVAALFQPLRRAIQASVDRRFYRSRYDASRTAERFSALLRQQVDLRRLSGDLAGAVEEALQPTTVTVWIREDVS